MKQKKKLWAGRFEKPVSKLVEEFTESVSFDRRLYRQDIAGSRAHVRMLASCGLIRPKDRDAILAGLDQIETEIEAGKFPFRVDLEDVHMNIEAALIDRIGEPGRMLHTARSRNDQVALDVRLYVREETDEVLVRVRRLQESLLELAESSPDLVLPGYTHLQRAQPVLAAHYLLAFIEQFERDAGRLRDGQARMNLCPLGACALAGTSLPIDRHATAKELGFRGPMANSIDAVSDRDYLIEFLSALAILSMHLSRLAEDWVLWASEEFGFIVPDDSVSTGSSIMPQKKNPDPMELVRGKCGRVYGNLVALLTVTKGLPTAYNRDLQEDKEPLFDSVDVVEGCLDVTREFAASLRFREDRIQAVLDRGFLDATSLAEYLVKKGVPFRTAHGMVGRLVRTCSERSIPLAKLQLPELKEVCDRIGRDVYQVLGVAGAIRQFRSYGSTGRKQVSSQLRRWRSRLGKKP